MQAGSIPAAIRDNLLDCYSCGEYTANLVFREKCDTDVMIPIKELIMSAYDLRKQQEERKTG